MDMLINNTEYLNLTGLEVCILFLCNSAAGKICNINEVNINVIILLLLPWQQQDNVLQMLQMIRA